MRGTDILKAMAYGASAVGLGRLACLGLAADGEDGLVATLELLREELRGAKLGTKTISLLDSK